MCYQNYFLRKMAVGKVESVVRVFLIFSSVEYCAASNSTVSDTALNIS